MSRAEEIFEKFSREGLAAIERLFAQRASEELFLDFKASSDSGTGDFLSANDRKILAKAISGFGNSEGGVIVWGVGSSAKGEGADFASVRKPIASPERFVGWLEDAVSGATIPPHTGVRSIAIRDVGENARTGFAVTLIPKSNLAPHQTVGDHRYLIRAGTSFVPTPHGVLAGLFGRRPQPFLYVAFGVPRPKCNGPSLVGEIEFVVRNDGPGIARDIFLNLAFLASGGPRCVFRWSTDSGKPNWRGVRSWGHHLAMNSMPGFWLAPWQHAVPASLRYQIEPPFESDLIVEIQAGCDGSVPHLVKIGAAVDQLRTVYQDCYSKLSSDPKADCDIGSAFAVSSQSFSS